MHKLELMGNIIEFLKKISFVPRTLMYALRSEKPKTLWLPTPFLTLLHVVVHKFSLWAACLLLLLVSQLGENGVFCSIRSIFESSSRTAQ